MCDDKKRTPRRAVVRAALAAAITLGMGGCQAVREMVALPFDVAAYAAAEAARLPYETAKMGAQGLFDVIAGAMR